MNKLAFNVSGIGVVTVTKPDGQVSVTKSNQILKTFTDWAFTAIVANGIRARCKVGMGTQPNNPDTNRLENMMWLETGFPQSDYVEGLTATLISGGSAIEAVATFSFEYPVGAVIDTVTEFGLDFTDVVRNTPEVHTRVCLVDDEFVKGIEVGPGGKLRIDYTLRVNALVNQPEIPFTVNYSDGSTSQHTAQIIWAPLRKFNWYVPSLFSSPLDSFVQLRRLTTKPANFVKVPSGNVAAYVDMTVGAPVKDEDTGVWSVGLQLPPTSGNDAEGYNYLYTDVSYSTGGIPVGGWWINPPIKKTPEQILTLTLQR